MSGLISITVEEARGFVAVDSDIDNLAVVIGCTSAGTGLSPFYLSGPSAVAGVGYGDAVDLLTQVIEQRQEGSPVAKKPAAIFSTETDTAGSYGTIDTSGVAGTSVVTVDATSIPLGTYESQLLIVDGGTVGVAGITLRWSLDGGRNFSTVTSLGTANTFTIPNSDVKYNFAAGTLLAADLATCETFGPQPGTTELADAFTALAEDGVNCGIIAIEMDMTAAIAATVTTGLNTLAAAGIEPVCLVRCRARTAAETEAAWLTAVAGDFANFDDSRIVVRAAYELVTDAMTSRQYLRSDLWQFAADVVRVPRFTWPASPSDRAMPNASLVDGSGTTVGHDEGPRGAVTGLSDDTLGNRFSCVQRLPDPSRREDVFNTVPWTSYASDDRVRNLMTRRLVNAMKRVARGAATGLAGGRLFYNSTGGSTGTLTEPSRNAAQGTIYQALSTEFKSEIGNAEDASLDSGLVQVSPNVTVSGGNLLGLSLTLAPEIGGFVLSINMTLSILE